MVARLALKSVVGSILLGASLTPIAAPPASATSCVDVALVLAVDSSGSISAGEYVLQRNAIAAAFRNRQVLDAVERAGQVAVSIVFWGSEDQPKPQSRWFLISGKSGAEQFARAVETMPRRVTGDTGLGSGLLAAVTKFDSLPSCSQRKIINVSGDGSETLPGRGRHRQAVPSRVRDLAASRDIAINALAISTEEPDLRQYYAANVITGPGSFVMEVRSYVDFAVALRRKLEREIGPRVVTSRLSQPRGTTRLD